MGRLIQWLKGWFAEPNWTEWIDIGVLGGNGYAKLLQMKVNLDDNSKVFRQTRLGWVNETYKQTLFDKILLHPAATLRKCVVYEEVKNG